MATPKHSRRYLLYVAVAIAVALLIVGRIDLRGDRSRQLEQGVRNIENRMKEKEAEMAELQK